MAAKADAAGAHDAAGLALQVEAGEPGQAKVVFPGAVVGPVYVAVQGEQQRRRVLRHGAGGIAGHPAHGDAVFLGGPQVHVVKPSAAQGDELDAGLRQSANGPGA